ncbi:MAG: Zn-dependent protease [Alphaproteobacteria bacterium]|nr:Zn-dependent protease [Alphaproteobacteria bacterium]
MHARSSPCLPFRTALGFAGALLCVLATPACAEQPRVPSTRPPLAFAGVPNLTFAYYDVSGRTIDEIRRSLDARQPRDPNDGTSVAALSSWSMRWGWRARGGGGCDLANPSIDFGARIQLPRLVTQSELAPELLARWRRFIAAVEAHESRHVRYAYEHRRDVAAAIRASDCAGAASAAAAAVRAIAQRDIDYDRATRHGTTEGAVFP